MLFSQPLPPPHEWIKLKTHTITVNGGEPMPHRTSMNPQKQGIH